MSETPTPKVVGLRLEIPMLGRDNRRQRVLLERMRLRMRLHAPPNETMRTRARPT